MKRKFVDMNKMRYIVNEMKSVDQQLGIQSVWEHCLSVSHQYIKLSKILKEDAIPQEGFYIPPTFLKYLTDIKGFKKLNPNIMRKYLVFHDIGKPFCAVKDVCG